MHAARKFRHGDVHAVKIPLRRRIGSNGYVILSGHQGHPLANDRGELYEHRLVLWEKVGPGIHACFHCRTPISWTNGTLVADHLDWDKQNNVPENLVQSCQPCNKARVDPNRIPILASLVCDECSARFQAENALRHYCSDQCVKAAHNRSKRIARAQNPLPRKVSTLACAQCDAAFNSSRSSSLYCSVACRNKAYRKRLRDG